MLESPAVYLKDKILSLHRAKLDHLKAELAEARAQIAAKDAQIKELKDALRRSDGRQGQAAHDEDDAGG